jgi:maltooligosyltrehalose trehalohydrolase
MSSTVPSAGATTASTLFAPTRLYGTPDELRHFVDRAHALGLGVILDVVYNHFGPSGNYLAHFSPHYISKRYENEWGEAINFDGAESGPVREFFACNAEYWIREFHFDGLRLDATQCLFDASETHIVAEVAQRARAAAGRRSIYLCAENEPSMRRWRARWSAAARAWTRCGTTTSTTARSSRPPAPARPTTRRRAARRRN